MTLNFGLFPERTAEVSDEGALNTSFNGNQISLAIFSGELDVGSILNVYDNDVATYLGTSSPPTTPGTRYILLTFNKLFKNYVITLYFSAYHPGGSGTTTVTFQSSINNVDWTDLSEIIVTSAETARNYNAVIASMKYLRLKCLTTYNGAAGCGGRIYEMFLVKR